MEITAIGRPLSRISAGGKYFYDDGRQGIKKKEGKPFQQRNWVMPAEKSASFVHQMEQVLSVYERPYSAAYPVVCLDESPKQLIDYKEFTSESGRYYKDSEYIRRGVVDLFVATEPLAGRRILTVEADHKAATWVKFVANALDTTYKSATKVTWVMDNLSTHKLSFFYDHFPPHQAKSYIDRMEIIHTPAHGSWLNMAEIEFSILTRTAFKQPFANKAQVEEVVAKWVKQQNEKKRKINWQFTTADARIKLSRLYPTI